MNHTPAPKHLPVMRDQVLAHIAPADGEAIVDGTFGAGGYTQAFLDQAECTVYAIDRDPAAIRIAKELAGKYGKRLIVLEGRFSEMDALLKAAGIDRVDAVALDIGVSSMQLDEAARGFSFQADGPLDMRMGGTGETAADVVNSLPEADLADVIYKYGEEHHSRRIAAAIVAARKTRPITRTAELAGIVAGATGFRASRGARAIHPATKTFQALRIYVNQELEELEKGLEAAERLLKEGGRLAVVSFHSLEDRIVKTFLQERSGNLPNVSRHLPADPRPIPNPTFTLAGRKAEKSDTREVAANPRARSARLRKAVRTDAAPWTEQKTTSRGAS